MLALAVALAAAGAVHAAEPDAAARAARQAELHAVTRDIQVTEERQAELRAEIAALDQDRASLNQTLLDTGKRVQDLETRIADTEARLEALGANEDAIRASLAARRDVLAEVLAALQRMGHRPPPAIAVRPEDALASVRSAILLGAVVPDLREAADKLANDLKSLIALKNEMAAERDRLRQDALALAESGPASSAHRREARQRPRRRPRTRSGVMTLAAQATNLKDLIARLEKEINAAAGKAAADSGGRQPRRGGGKRPRSAPPPRPAVPRRRARLLPMPASGKARTGEPDAGGKTDGISIATRPGAVSALSDGCRPCRPVPQLRATLDHRPTDIMFAGGMERSMYSRPVRSGRGARGDYGPELASLAWT